MKYANSPEVPALLKEFLQHIYAIKNKSELTVEEYCIDNMMFLRFLKQNKGLAPSSSELSEIDVSDINIDFIKELPFLTLINFFHIARMSETMILPQEQERYRP